MSISLCSFTFHWVLFRGARCRIKVHPPLDLKTAILTFLVLYNAYDKYGKELDDSTCFINPYKRITWLGKAFQFLKERR
ncbi:MAG TPA: hypothetical protein PLL63_13260 [Niabella sp.]|nr:hypothetical protein [Niabella sp.]HRB07068.1 hypothetical protein [Niabella sp.]HRB28278.1 hypothetical protein [Niabella sp.]HRB49095.1 hypothetical protein [Niabella sp.]HRB58642.1 hypothetical protein [Niabella sp.]